MINSTANTFNPEKTALTLHENFGFPCDLIMECFNRGISSREMKDICLHAYAAGVPLEKVIELRRLYVWGRVRYLLGLTPEKYQKRLIDYHADRLLRIAGIDREITFKYMKLGYASHQVKRAWYIAKHCNVPMEEILKMKTRLLKWADVAEKLGLSREACMY